ncbi:MAG: MurR/RpiR family transcriptional regulator [Lachnospiraceae bacterium]|nr:MurR/RpiR family transcriptional regulator [Lachnospiraceae bacterium]
MINPFLETKLNYPQMNPAMRRVADVVLSNEDRLRKMTIGKMASESGVSNATVTRFIHVLGFRNYKEFSAAVRYFLEEMPESARNIRKPSETLINSEFRKNSSPESICRFVIQSEIEMLKDTLALMDYDLMREVVAMIMSARQVLFLGEGRSYLAGMNACSRFLRLGIVANCYSDYHSMVGAAASCTEEDLVVGISNMGRTASVVECLGIARKNGAATVAITSAKGSVVDQSADITLLTGYDYSSFLKDQQIVCYEADAENLPQYAIVDSLYLMCVAAADESAIDRYRLTADLINAKRM